MPEDVSYPHSPDCTLCSLLPSLSLFLNHSSFHSILPYLCLFSSRFVSLRLTCLSPPSNSFNSPFPLSVSVHAFPSPSLSLFLCLPSPPPRLSWRECKQVSLCFLGLPSPCQPSQHPEEEAALSLWTGSEEDKQSK